MERRGEMRDDRKRRWDRAKPQPSRKALVHFLQAAAQDVGFGQDAMRVIEHEAALIGEAVEFMAALDDRRAEILFKLADRRRSVGCETWQAAAARPEVFFARQSDEIFELTQYHRRLPQTPRLERRDSFRRPIRHIAQMQQSARGRARIDSGRPIAIGLPGGARKAGSARPSASTAAPDSPYFASRLWRWSGFGSISARSCF